MIHELPLERRTLHGHFSRELPAIATIDSGDTIAFSSLDAGWHVRPGEYFEPRNEKLDAGHPLIGPVDIRGARKGQTLEVRIDAVRVGKFGFTVAGGWPTRLNDRLDLGEGDRHLLRWSLNAGAGTARDDRGREVELRPFLGVMGMPPDLPGVHPTGPPRPCGGNIDCKELIAGTTLFVPIPVNGAHFSAGDGHGRQGDGEVSGTAIECPLERAELTLTVRDDLPLRGPVARTGAAWITFGFDEDLDEAAAVALDAMLELMGREHGLARRDALALASVVVDLRVTQVVNGVSGVHAVLDDAAIRMV
jgi:acetamidase/formamidase